MEYISNSVFYVEASDQRLDGGFSHARLISRLRKPLEQSAGFRLV